MKVVGKNVYIKLLSPKDVSEAYVQWMRDEEILQFLESRWKTYEEVNLKEYVREVNKSSNEFLFGIFLNNTGEHIGNIKIGGINQIHRFGEIGLIIGDKKKWGKGYGTEALNLANYYAFSELNLNKLVAGIYAPNEASCRAFEKAKYRKVGVLKSHRFYKGKYVDQIIMEKCHNE